MTAGLDAVRPAFGAGLNLLMAMENWHKWCCAVSSGIQW